MTEEEFKKRSAEATAKLLSTFKDAKRPVKLVEPKGICEVCGTEETEDLIYMGPGVAGLQFGCGHTMHSKRGEKTRWVDAAGNLVLEK